MPCWLTNSVLEGARGLGELGTTGDGLWLRILWVGLGGMDGAPVGGGGAGEGEDDDAEGGGRGGSELDDGAGGGGGAGVGCVGAGAVVAGRGGGEGVSDDRGEEEMIGEEEEAAISSLLSCSFAAMAASFSLIILLALPDRSRCRRKRYSGTGAGSPDELPGPFPVLSVLSFTCTRSCNLLNIVLIISTNVYSAARLSSSLNL